MKPLLLSSSDIVGGAAIAGYRLHQGLRSIGRGSRMLVREKHSSDSDVSAWPHPRPEKDRWLDALADGLQINARTPLSSTYFSLPWPGEDIAGHPLVQGSDVLNLHWVTHFISPEGLRALLATGKPVILTLHDQRAFTGGCHYSAGCEGFVRDCPACPQLRPEYHDIASGALALSKACLDGVPAPVIVAPSRWLAAEAQRSALFSGCRVEVIPYGLDLEVFRPADRAAALEYFGLPANSRVVLFGAQTLDERRKGFDVLQDAIKRLMADDATATRLREQHVVFACYGLGGGTLRSTGLPIYLLGEQATTGDMVQLLSASSLFICPTREDNLPNTIMEAMACGVPVLASNVGGVPDMITDGVHGRLVPPDDPAALAAAVMDFAARPDTWHRWGAEGRRKCEAQYSLAHQGSAYARLFSELAASRREPVLEPFTSPSIVAAAEAMTHACEHLSNKLREEEEARVRQEQEAARARAAAQEAATAAAKAAEPNPKADLERVEEELRKCRRNPFWFLHSRARALKRQRQSLKDEIQRQKDAKRAARLKPKPAPTPALPRQPDATLGSEGGPLCDALLVISASEINGSHGTGVLLRRLLKNAPPFIHLRSMNLYGGQSEAAQRICVPLGAIATASVPGLLHGSSVARILSVPYDRSDVENTLAFHDATGAPLCVWLMDHNLGEGRRQIPHGMMQQLLDRAQLRLGISAEFCELYRDLFKHEVHFAPPVVDAHLGQRTLLHLPPEAFQPAKGVLLGNVWSHVWMKKLVGVLTKTSVPLVAFGNMSPPGVKNEKLAALLQARGYLPEPELVIGLRQHPFALVPTGTLDEEDDLPSIARYSLPSRTLYLSAVGNLPIIVIGHEDTGVARFVTRHGLGIVVPYDARRLREAVNFICEPEQQVRFRRQAARLAPFFACDDMADWLWKSLDMRGPSGDRWREFSGNTTTPCHP